MSSSVTKFCTSGIFNPPKHLFNLSLQTGFCQIARVSSIFKKDEKFFFTSYKPISVLPCFSKLLEWIMYNRLYKYLLKNNRFYEKQFGVQALKSTEHVVIQIISQILDAFNENKYTLCKAFDTVDHKIFLKK